jgi:hypothetical protein
MCGPEIAVDPVRDWIDVVHVVMQAACVAHLL